METTENKTAREKQNRAIRDLVFRIAYIFPTDTDEQKFIEEFDRRMEHCEKLMKIAMGEGVDVSPYRSVLDEVRGGVTAGKLFHDLGKIGKDAVDSYFARKFERIEKESHLYKK